MMLKLLVLLGIFALALASKKSKMEHLQTADSDKMKENKEMAQKRFNDFKEKLKGMLDMYKLRDDKSKRDDTQSPPPGEEFVFGGEVHTKYVGGIIYTMQDLVWLQYLVMEYAFNDWWLNNIVGEDLVGILERVHNIYPDLEKVIEELDNEVTEEP